MQKVVRLTEILQRKTAASDFDNLDFAFVIFRQCKSEIDNLSHRLVRVRRGQNEVALRRPILDCNPVNYVFHNLAVLTDATDESHTILDELARHLFNPSVHTTRRV